MAQIAKISEQVQLKSSGHEFYEFLRNNMDHLARMFPGDVESYNFVTSYEILHGGVFSWKYHTRFDGSIEAKVRQPVDQPNKTLIHECREGDLFKDFKEFQVKIQVTDGYKWRKLS